MATVKITGDQLLEALKALQVSVPEPTMGICGNLDYHLAKKLGAEVTDYFVLGSLGISNYGWVGEVSQNWPKYSGHYTMPVPLPCPEKPTPTNKWEGEYGALRLELLDFLIRELESASID